jgi:TolA-binding protein
MGDGEGLKGRVTRQSEETIGKLAQELLQSPVVSGALSRAFETRERAMRAQEVAMGALNLPSASDLERLTRRVRSVSQRLEGIEDGLDRLDDRLQRPSAGISVEGRLTSIERTLERLETGQAAAAADAAKAVADSRAAPPSSAGRPKAAARKPSKPVGKRAPATTGAKPRSRKPSS